MSLSLAGNGTLTGVDSDASGLLALSRGIGTNVVTAGKTDFFTTTSTTYTGVTGLSVTITPSSDTSKILVIGTIVISILDVAQFAVVRLVRGTTAIGVGTQGSGINNSSGYTNRSTTSNVESVALSVLDSPNTSGPVTYAWEMAVTGSTGTVNRRGDGTTNSFFSSITAIEVAA